MRVPDQGGTRKIVALAHTVDHLLRSLKTFQAALHARRGQGEGTGRRGTQTKAHLISVGRRLTALNFVTFLVAVRDLLQTQVTPLALKAQAVEVTPWEMDRLCQSTVDHLRQAAADLQTMGRWCFISSLMQQYLGGNSLKHMWSAVAPLFKKAFPCLSVNLFPLMHLTVLQGCQLSVVQHGSEYGYRTLSPKCQCPSMRSAPGRRLAKIRIRRMSRTPGGKHYYFCREYMVPEWVAYSAYGPGEWAHPPLGPRFVRVRQGPLPHALQGVPNLF